MSKKLAEVNSDSGMVKVFSQYTGEMSKKLAEVNSDSGMVKVFSQYTGECVIEYTTSPHDALGAYYALEKAVRNAEKIAYAEAKRTLNN